MNPASSFPFHLWPLSAHLCRGRLHLAGIDLATWAKAAGTPVYLYDAATFDHMVACYRTGLASWPGPGLITYAGKAWLNLPVVQLLRRRRLGLDVVSPGELGIAKSGSIEMALVHAHGNNKPMEFLQTAINEGVGAIVVDNLWDLDRLERMAAADAAPVKLWLRLNPDLLAPTHRYRQTGHLGSKFGLSWEEVLPAAERIRAHPGLLLTGLHAHIGSQIVDVAPLLEAAGRLVALAAALKESGHAPLTHLCPGGGLGQHYHPDDERLDIAAAVKRIASHCAQEWRRYNLGAFPTLVLEPGRSLIARAGIALYTVGAIRCLPDGSRIVAVDGSMADNPRPALYGARYTASIPSRPAASAAGPARIAGPLCESGDILIEDILLPDVQAGDILAVPMSGAYQLSMASNYNASMLPAVYWLEAGQVQLIQRRQTLADLTARDLPLPT